MMKRKFIAPLIALLLCVSMIGVGFAGWVITTSTQQDASGNFTVYTVTDNRYSFVANTNASVVFGYSGTPTHPEGVTADWLVKDSVGAQDLVPDFVLTSTTKVKKGDTIKYVVSDVAVNDYNNQWKNAKDKGLVKEPDSIAGNYTFAISNSGSITIQKDGGATTGVTANYNAETETLTVTFSNAAFKWGDITNGQNPYQFFNSNKPNVTYTLPQGATAPTTVIYGESKTYADIAYAMLQALEGLEYDSEAKTGVTFSVTVTGSRNS